MEKSDYKNVIKLLLIRTINAGLLVLVSSFVFGQTSTLIKSDSVNLCILKVDFNTLTFEGGNMSYHKRVHQNDSLPLIFKYNPPLDFGFITIQLKTTLDTVFSGSIIWMGRGKINYPRNYQLDSPYNSDGNKIARPKNIEYFNVDGSKIKEDTFILNQANLAWEAINSLHITNEFANFDFKAGIYIYPPTVGSFDPNVAKWIIFLYYEESLGGRINLINASKIELSPNPAENVININSNEIFDYKIYDLRGRHIKSSHLQSNQINIEDLVPGVYNITLYNDKQVFNKKIVKVNNR